MPAVSSDQLNRQIHEAVSLNRDACFCPATLASDIYIAGRKELLDLQQYFLYDSSLLTEVIPKFSAHERMLTIALLCNGINDVADPSRAIEIIRVLLCAQAGGSNDYLESTQRFYLQSAAEVIGTHLNPSDAISLFVDAYREVSKGRASLKYISFHNDYTWPYTDSELLVLKAIANLPSSSLTIRELMHERVLEIGDRNPEDPTAIKEILVSIKPDDRELLVDWAHMRLRAEPLRADALLAQATLKLFNSQQLAMTATELKQRTEFSAADAAFFLHSVNLADYHRLDVQELDTLGKERFAQVIYRLLEHQEQRLTRPAETAPAQKPWYARLFLLNRGQEATVKSSPEWPIKPATIDHLVTRHIFVNQNECELADTPNFINDVLPLVSRIQTLSPEHFEEQSTRFSIAKEFLSAAMRSGAAMSLLHKWCNSENQFQQDVALTAIHQGITYHSDVKAGERFALLRVRVNELVDSDRPEIARTAIETLISFQDYLQMPEADRKLENHHLMSRIFETKTLDTGLAECFFPLSQKTDLTEEYSLIALDLMNLSSDDCFLPGAVLSWFERHLEAHPDNYLWRSTWEGLREIEQTVRETSKQFHYSVVDKLNSLVIGYGKRKD